MKMRIEFVQYILLIFGEAAWGYLWALALGRWFGGGTAVMDLSSLLALLLAALISTRLALSWINRHRLGEAAYSSLGLLVICAVALYELPAVRQGFRWEEALYQLFNTGFGGRVALVGIFSGFFWRRGTLMGRSLPDGSSVEESFRTGSVALISLLVVSALAGGYAPVPGDQLVLPTLTFICTSLIGMSLAQVTDVSRSSLRRGGGGVAPTAPWLAMLLVIVAAILTTTLLLAQLLTFDRVSRVWDAVKDPLGAILSFVVWVAAIPFALLVEVLLFLARLIYMLGGQQPQPRKTAPSLSQQLPQPTEIAEIPPELLLVLKLLAAVILGILFLWLLIRAISHLRKGWQQEGIDESRDFVWSWPGLGSLWRWIVARIKPVARIPTLATRKQKPSANLGVRELYREFLNLGVSRGKGRKPAETPLEYESRLRSDPILTEGEAVRIITESYVRVRYEPPRETEPDIGVVAFALERLRAFWHNGKK